jgi:hypothetical protein
MMTNIIEFREVDISDDGWKNIEPSTEVGRGTSCDIHIWRPENTPVRSSYFPMTFKRIADFNTRLSTGTAGKELIIESIEPAYSVVLYDMKGRQMAFSRMLDNSRTIIPLHGIDNGLYLIQLNTLLGGTRKIIQIFR